MTPTSHDTFAAFVGIDWADAKHDICLQAAGTAKRECFQLDHTPEAIEAWVTTLRTRFSGQPVAVCLELTKGPLVSALRKYDFLVLFPINPLTLARYREAFTPSRAKDDPTDAELQLELLLTHRDKLQPLQPQSPAMRALEQLVEHRRRVVGDKVRITGIHVRRDDLVSVMYSTERNAATSSITRQRTDRHGILAEKSPAIQLFS